MHILNSNLEVMFIELKRPEKHLRAPKTDEHKRSVFNITAGIKLSMSAIPILYVTICSDSLPGNEISICFLARYGNTQRQFNLILGQSLIWD